MMDQAKELMDQFQRKKENKFLETDPNEIMSYRIYLTEFKITVIKMLSEVKNKNA